MNMTGGLGPLQGMGLSGAMVWAIKPGEESNTVSWTYNVPSCTWFGSIPESSLSTFSRSSKFCLTRKP